MGEIEREKNLSAQASSMTISSIDATSYSHYHSLDQSLDQNMAISPSIFIMSMLKKITLLMLVVVSLFLSACAPFYHLYDQPAYQPHDPSDVRVDVSLERQMVYVMEGKCPLLVTACCVGIPSKPTPKGNFKVTRKERNKRSGSYGFSLLGGRITAVQAAEASGHYVGYPMPYWVEFAPGYGFHQGWVWPVPRSHGCIRLHANDAGKFFELVRLGTPIHIANSQPEDHTLGAQFRRPNDYNSPDQPASLLVSPTYFEQLKKVFLQKNH